MFEKIKEFFTGKQEFSDSLAFDDEGNPSDEVLHVATAVVLIEMASADGDIAQEEAETVCQAMAGEFGLAEQDLPELVQVAIASRKEKGKIDEFVKLINERYNTKQRQKLLSMVWKVVMADGKVDKFEERFATQMKFRFKLNDEQADEARLMAEAGAVS